MAKQEKRNPWAIGGVVVLVLLLVGAGIYTWSGQLGKDQQAEDAAGQTQVDVSGKSVHEEFQTYGERYAHATTLLKNAQEAVHTQPWEVQTTGLTPQTSLDPSLPGANSRNSYYLSMRRSWEDTKKTDAAVRVKPMEEFFKEQGWKTSTRRSDADEHVRVVEAQLKDDWRVTYAVHPDGRNNLRVASPYYWTKSQASLSKAIRDRLSGDEPGHLSPGDVPDFPKW